MLLLGVAFSSSIGSITTLIASPPNLMYAEIINELFGKTITFGTWSSVATPLAITMLTISIIYFTGKVRKEQMDETLIRKIIVTEKRKVRKNYKRAEGFINHFAISFNLNVRTPYWAGDDHILKLKLLQFLVVYHYL